MAESRNQIANGADSQSAPPRRRSPESLANSTRQIQSDARNLATHVQEASNDLQGFVTEQVRDRPYTALAAAAGVGYVLGGGLSSKLTLLMFGMATRFAMAMAAKEMGAWATDGLTGATSNRNQH